jgi:hypothetical protein
MSFVARCAIALALSCGAQHALAASTFDTVDPGVIAAFKADATVQDFEGLNGLATAVPANGAPVPATNQLSKPGSGLTDVQSLAGLHFFSGGGTFGGGPGTPVAVLDVSGDNLLAPLTINTEELCVGAGCFFEVFFDTPVQRFGFDVGLGNVSIFAQTYGGNPLGGVDDATGTAGSFAGIVRDAADIERISIIANTTAGFTMDDLSYAVPEPSTLLLMALGTALLAAARRG